MDRIRNIGRIEEIEHITKRTRDEWYTELLKKTLSRLKEHEKVQKAFAFLKEDDERTLKEQLEMCRIPSPSGMEGEKAEYVRKKMQEAGLEDVRIDEVGNVLGVIRGTKGGPGVMLAAHTDTVFPKNTDLTIKRDGERYLCPGICDDTRGVAELLTIARAMKAAELRGETDLIFCANVCEEGLGDLKGVKHLFRDEKVYTCFVSIDDTLPGGIIYKATGSRRYQVTFRGPGGHSFTAFGTPNPIHAMGRATAMLADLEVPAEPRTTFNVGIVQGGTSVNTIAEECSMLVDLRSAAPKELEQLSENFLEIVEKAVRQENRRWKRDSQNGVTAEIQQIGYRPAGVQPESCKIVQMAVESCRLVGIEPRLLEAASTDANIPISLGIAAVTLGQGGAGGETHTVHEWFEPTEAYKGPQRDLLLLLGLAGFSPLEVQL